MGSTPWKSKSCCRRGTLDDILSGLAPSTAVQYFFSPFLLEFIVVTSDASQLKEALMPSLCFFVANETLHSVLFLVLPSAAFS